MSTVEENDVVDQYLYVGWPKYVYENHDQDEDYPELFYLQNFSVEHWYHKEGMTSFTQCLRIICLLFIFTNYVTACSFPLTTFLVPFTNWTLMVTTASIYMSYKAAQDTTNFGLKAFSSTGTDKVKVIRA